MNCNHISTVVQEHREVKNNQKSNDSNLFQQIFNLTEHNERKCNVQNHFFLW